MDQSRRDFLRISLMGLAGFSILSAIPGSAAAADIATPLKSRKVKFGIISDIHPDIMHDGPERLAAFLKEARKQKVDFIIETGDFCQAKDENIHFRNLWNDFPAPHYHVIGNHDLDIVDKPDYIAFAGLPSRYYSFDLKGFHFIVLDPNNIEVDGKCRSPFRSGRYGNMIDPEQLEWLRSDLAATDKRCLLFSHQSFERPDAVKNAAELRAILEDENRRAGYNKVIAALSGHDHTDYHKVINGIAYIQINSASNQWVGDDYKCDKRYTPEINAAHPWIKFTTPYKEPLFGFVTIDGNSLKIKGRKSSFVAPTPRELGIPEMLYGFPLTPTLSDIKFNFR